MCERKLKNIYRRGGYLNNYYHLTYILAELFIIFPQESGTKLELAFYIKKKSVYTNKQKSTPQLNACMRNTWAPQVLSPRLQSSLAHMLIKQNPILVQASSSVPVIGRVQKHLTPGAPDKQSELGWAHRLCRGQNAQGQKNGRVNCACLRPLVSHLPVCREAEGPESALLASGWCPMAPCRGLLRSKATVT